MNEIFLMATHALGPEETISVGLGANNAINVQ